MTDSEFEHSPENPDVVCALCEGCGSVTDTEGVVWDCPQGCHEEEKEV